MSLRDTLFRAATYFRNAEFFLHGNWDDPRINTYWEQNIACFTEAISHLPVPGERKLLPAQGFQVPIYWFRASADDNDDDESAPRPTLLLHIGFDSGAEETFHQHGLAALERGYNVVCLEGPGQGSVRRAQGLGFTPAWETVVAPVVDFLEAQRCVDAARIALLGMSFGGVLCARAAAREHRLAAVVCNDGLFDFSAPEIIARVGELGLDDEEGLRAFLGDESRPAKQRWGVAHGLWSFNVRTIAEFQIEVKKYTMKGLGAKVECPVFVGDADGDLFFKGQPQELAKELGDKATLVTFTAEDGADLHCHEGAARFSNQVMFDWLEENMPRK